MSDETWEQTKKRLKKQGIALSKAPVAEPPRPRYEEPKAEPPVKRFNIHKRSLPPGIDKVVVLAVTKAEAAWWVEHVLKTKSYQDDTRDTKTLIYFDVVPVDATPRERSIYHNPRPFVAELSEGERYFEDKQPYPDAVPEIDWQ